MVSWALVAVVILFPLLQVPAVIYIGRYCKLKEGETVARPPVRDFWTESDGDDEARRRDPSAVDPPPDAVVCPKCGTENDTEYRYCSGCSALVGAAD